MYDQTQRFFQSLKRMDIRCSVFVPIQDSDEEPERLAARMDAFRELMQQLRDAPALQIQKSSRGFRFNPAHRAAFLQCLRD